VKDTVGTTVEVRVADPETLPRSTGKLERPTGNRERTGA
jgi:phenylacetate-CoA ligase